METRPLRPRQHAVGDLADEDVAEGELALHATSPEGSLDLLEGDLIRIEA